MDRSRGVWYGMLGAFIILAIPLAAAPIQARTVSYSLYADFVAVIGSEFATISARIGGDDSAEVHDPDWRRHQAVPQFGSPTGTTPLTITNFADVPLLSRPSNAAHADSAVTVNAYSPDITGGTRIPGSYKIYGLNTANVPLGASSYATAFVSFEGQALNPQGQITYGPRAEYSASRSGGVAVVTLANINIEAVEHLLLQGITELSGDTSLLWDSSLPGKNFMIQAPAKSGNNVHFLLNLPGPITQDQGTLEVIIQDGTLQKFNKTGKIFEGVDIVHGGDYYYLLNLGPLNFGYHMGDVSKKPKFKVAVETSSNGQLAQRAKVMPGNDLLLLD
jgi:hypothetical protein